MSLPESIDIDARPTVLAELPGTIITLASGAPQLGPAQGQAHRWASALHRLKGKATYKHVSVILEREKDARSPQQNAYLWKCYQIVLEGVRQVAADNGVACPFASKDDVHDWWRRHELGDVERVEFVGGPIERRTSTTRRTVHQFFIYVENLREHVLHRWRIYVPTPKEMGEDAWLEGRTWESLAKEAA